MTIQKTRQCITIRDFLAAICWILFIAVSLTHLIYINNTNLENSRIIIRITKCQLLPILMLIFIIRRFKQWNKTFWFIILAMFFAFLGDVLLIKWIDNQWLFLGGLAAFLIGHIFSIIFITINSEIKKNKYWFLILIPFAVLPLVIWQISLIKDSLVIPISIFFYAIMLCILLGISLTLIPVKDIKIYLPAVIGSLLFVISDITLGLGSFRHVWFPPITVMTTYILAQVFLCILYLNLTNKKITS